MAPTLARPAPEGHGDRYNSARERRDDWQAPQHPAHQPEGVLLDTAKLIMPAIAASASPKKKPRTKPSRAMNSVLI